MRISTVHPPAVMRAADCQWKSGEKSSRLVASSKTPSVCTPRGLTRKIIDQRASSRASMSTCTRSWLRTWSRSTYGARIFAGSGS